MVPSYLIRWYYEVEYFEDDKWIPLCGYESSLLEELWSTINGDNKPDNADIVNEDLYILGGLYKVDMKLLIARAIWSNDSRVKLTRGLWFLNFKNNGYLLPFSMDSCNILEKIHHSVRKLLDDPTESSNFFSKTQIHYHGNCLIHECNNNDFCNHVQEVERVDVEGWKCIWYSDGSIYAINNESFYKRLTNEYVLIQRGYGVYPSHIDKVYPIGHVVFVIHGMGYAHVANVFEQNTFKLSKELKNIRKSFQLVDRREQIVFIPINWRKESKLAQNTISLITPESLPKIRSFLNSTFLDILYMISDKYRKQIIDLISYQINCIICIIYGLATSKPELVSNNFLTDNFSPFSILGHSLGSIASFELLSRGLNVQIWNRIKTNKFIFDKYVEHDNLNCGNIIAPIKNLFLIGSSLSVYLVMKKNNDLAISNSYNLFPSQHHDSLLNEDSINPNTNLPRNICKRLFNLYDIADFMAYRLEPLIMQNYSVFVPRVSYEHYLEEFTSIVNGSPNSLDLFHKISRYLTSIDTRNKLYNTIFGCVDDLLKIWLHPYPTFPDRILFNRQYTKAGRHFMLKYQLLDNLTNESRDSHSNSFINNQVWPNKFKQSSPAPKITSTSSSSTSSSKEYFKYFNCTCCQITSQGYHVNPLKLVKKEGLAVHNKNVNRDENYHRIDFELCASSGLFSIVGSHSSYWSSQSLVTFIWFYTFFN